MTKMAEFFQEDDGSLSATRLALLVWVIGVLITWIFVSIGKTELQPIDNSITAILGILMTGKVVQKFGEKPGPDLAAAPQTPHPVSAAPTPQVPPA